MSARYIPHELVLTIYADLLQRYGGKPGVRDRGLLESALAQQKMTFGGKDVHKTLFDEAAACGFHICNNHPFVDGNKRVALVLMDLFLQKNGWEITASEESTYLMMISLASGKLSRQKLSLWLKQNTSRVRD